MTTVDEPADQHRAVTSPPPPLGPAYRALWFASAASAVGTGMTVIALQLVAASGDDDGLVLGIIAAAGMIPGLVFALPSGVLADRFDRRRLLIASDLGRAVVLLAATLAVLTDHTGVAVLATVAFLIGLGETVYVGSAQALVPLVVQRASLDVANGRLQAAEDTSREFIGPPLGSLAYKVAAWLPFAADAVTYVLSASLLARMPSPPHEPPAERLSVRPAWAVIRGSRVLTTLLISLCLLAMSGSAVLAILVLVVRDELGVDEAWFGAFTAVLAVGSTVAGVSAGRLRSVMSARVSMVVAVALNAWAYLVLGLTDQWPIALAALLMWGFAVTYGMVTSLGIRQRLIPLQLLGRTMGLFRTAVGAGGVLGAVAGGVLASRTSPTTVATVAGLVQLPVVLVLLVGLRGVDTAPPAPHEPVAG